MRPTSAKVKYRPLVTCRLKSRSSGQTRMRITVVASPSTGLRQGLRNSRSRSRNQRFIGIPIVRKPRTLRADKVQLLCSKMTVFAQKVQWSQSHTFCRTEVQLGGSYLLASTEPTRADIKSPGGRQTWCLLGIRSGNRVQFFIELIK